MVCFRALVGVKFMGFRGLGLMRLQRSTGFRLSGLRGLRLLRAF